MKQLLIHIIILMSTIFYLNAQDVPIELVFDGFYEIREGDNGEKYYSILFDSTYYKNENMTFLRVLKIGNNFDLAESLIKGQTYSFSLQRKLEQSVGCENHLTHIRSGRGLTDEGTLFGSNYLEEQKAIAAVKSCNYIVIEYYYILVINNKGD